MKRFPQSLLLIKLFTGTDYDPLVPVRRNRKDDNYIHVSKHREYYTLLCYISSNTFINHYQLKLFIFWSGIEVLNLRIHFLEFSLIKESINFLTSHKESYEAKERASFTRRRILFLFERYAHNLNLEYLCCHI
jgi:hypothetical protein